MSSEQVFNLLQDGARLSSDEIEQLEKTLQKDPTNVSARIKLIGYYGRKRFKDREMRSLRITHLGWFVDNHPDHELFSLAQDVMRDYDGRAAFSDLKQRWLKQIAQTNVKSAVLQNAAHFFIHDDKNFAERCLLKAKELEPTEDQWSSELASLYRLWGTGYEHKALDECKRALTLMKDPEHEFYQLTNLPELAYSAAQYDDAADAANKLLTMSSEFKSDWNYGNALNDAHTVLGLVALQKSDREGARHHLIESAKDAASPQTQSFGPNMRLAAELIAVGEVDVIERYWDLCETFWHSGQLADWRAELRSGDNPLENRLDKKGVSINLLERPRQLYNNGQYLAAGSAAEHLLRIANAEDEDRQGFALHVANVVLGQLALRRGDLAVAKMHLHSAANVPYSKRLAHHGPDLSLAADLAQAGEAAAAITFLTDVEKYWSDGAEKPNPSDFIDKAQKGTLLCDLLW